MRDKSQESMPRVSEETKWRLYKLWPEDFQSIRSNAISRNEGWFGPRTFGWPELPMRSSFRKKLIAITEFLDSGGVSLLINKR